MRSRLGQARINKALRAAAKKWYNNKLREVDDINRLITYDSIINSSVSPVLGRWRLDD